MGLTNLRAPYGFLHYGRGKELREVFRRFLAAVVRQPATYQQYHPVTGKGGAPKSVLLYSPTAAFVVDAVARLHGVVPRGRHLEWNLAVPAGSQTSRYEMDLGGKTYRLECAAGSCSGSLDGRKLFYGRAPSIVYTDHAGRPVPQAAVRDFPRLRSGPVTE